MHRLIVINSITLIKHLLMSTNHKPTHSAAFFLMRSITLLGTLFQIGQARQTTDHAIYVCVCRQITSCKLWQAALKKYPPPGGGGVEADKFRVSTKHQVNYSSVYFNIHVFRYNTELWDFSTLCYDMQSSCRLYSVTLLLQCDRLPYEEDT